MFNKIKAIKNIRDQAKAMQTEMEKIVGTGKAAGGKIEVSVNGNQTVTKVSIDESLMGDKAALESGLAEATNKAFKSIQKEMAMKMKDMGGMEDMLKNLGLS